MYYKTYKECKRAFMHLLRRDLRKMHQDQYLQPHADNLVVELYQWDGRGDLVFRVRHVAIAPRHWNWELERYVRVRLWSKNPENWTHSILDLWREINCVLVNMRLASKIVD